MKGVELSLLLNRIHPGIAAAKWETAGHSFRLSVWGPDNGDSDRDWQDWPGRWWTTKGLDEPAVIRTALLAVLTYVEHEARERFKVDGQSLFENTH